MSAWDEPPTTLTSFGPLSSDISEGTSLFSRLWNRNKNSSRSSSREASVERNGASKDKAPTTVSNSKSSLVSTEKEDTKPTLAALKVDGKAEGHMTPKPTGHVTSKPNSHVTKLTLNDIHRASTSRTLTSVLTRLSSIVRTGETIDFLIIIDTALGRHFNTDPNALKTPQTYKDSDFKQYWMPDESCKECYDCGDKFTTFRRRHHCRICGQIFCSKCCNQELQGRIIGYKGGIRVCTYCGKVAMKALQNEPSGNISVGNKEELQLSIESEPQVYSPWGAKKRVSRDMSRTTSVTPGTPSIDVLIPFDLEQNSSEVDMNTGLGRKFLEDSVQLREIWRQILDLTKGVEMQSHRIRLKTYYRCIVGCKLVDWLLANDKAAQRLQAVAIGQALLDAGYLEIIGSQKNLFQDNFTLYKPSETTPIDPPENTNIMDSTEPQWLQEIDVKTEQIESSLTDDTSNGQGTTTESTFYVPLPSTEDKDFEPLPRQDSHLAGFTDDIISASMFGSTQAVPASKMIQSVCWRNSDSLKEDNGERKAYSLLKRAYQDHLNGLVLQMLSDEGLSKSWMDIVLGTAQRVSNYVRPDVRQEGDDMNILKYVNFKKIPGESKEQTMLIHGVVFTRNIAHKQMAHKLVNPYILLLKGSIEYQRVENKFSSLEPQILQEEEFLKKNVKKISSLHPKPNVVIVEKSVSRLAQNYLLEKGITLVYNVKLCVMERIERLTQGSIVPSIDNIVSGPITLGFCHNFKVCHFSLPTGENKTLLCFDGCAQHLGCTIVLRGGTQTELMKIKKILKQMIIACYNSQLEISYCMDEFGMPESRADDTLTESDSIMDLTDTKTPVKVSDYLKDTKSGVNLANMNSKEEEIKRVPNVVSDNEIPGNEKVTKPVFDLGIDEATNDTSDHDNKSMSMGLEKINDAGSSSENKTVTDHSESTGSFISTVQNGPTHDSPKHLEAPSKVQVKRGDSPAKFKRQSSGLIPLDDQSDPLYMYQKNKDDAIFYSSVTLQEKVQKRCAKFHKTLSERLLSSTPYIIYEVPYLETEAGSRSIIRKFFKEDLYWSKYFERIDYREMKKQLYDTHVIPKQASPWAEVEIREPHPLMLTQITGSLNDKDMQWLIADFRARGGRIHLKPKNNVHHVEKTENHQPVEKTNPATDCLEYGNHQSFTVLLSSHSEKSTNYPNPCVPPQLVMMPFYQGNDITLGGFLEKFCFRESYCCQPYMCPSENCEVPLLDHVRRIVHDHGSIFISLRKLSNCVPGGDKDIMMWNWCRKCRQATPLAAMSNDTWSLSFAKFLELRFSVNTFTRRIGQDPCNHSLHHSFSQYFGHKNIVATFKYMPIIKKEIVLPHSVIVLRDTVELHQWTALRESMRSVEKRGLEMYNGILEQLVSLHSTSDELKKMVDDLTHMLENEKQRLKEMIHEGRQKALSKEEEKSDSAPEFFTLYDDSLKMMRFLADADINWRSKMQELYSQHKKTSRSSQSKKERDITQSLDMSSQQRKDLPGSSPSHREIGIQYKKDTTGIQPQNKQKGLPVKKETQSSSNELLVDQPNLSDLLPFKEIPIIPGDVRTNIQEPILTNQTDQSKPEPSSAKQVLPKERRSVSSGEITRIQEETEKQRSLTFSGETQQRNNSVCSTGMTSSGSVVLVSKSDIPSDDQDSLSIDQSYILAESGIYSVTPGLSAGLGQYKDGFKQLEDSQYVLLQINDGDDSKSTTSSSTAKQEDPSTAVTAKDEIEAGTSLTSVPENAPLAPTAQMTGDNTSQPRVEDPQPRTTSIDSVEMEFNATHALTEVQIDSDKKPKPRRESGKKTDEYSDNQQIERFSGMMKKTITNFLSGSGLPPLPFPFDCKEHHLLPTCYKVPVVIYDQEPSSIIAYGLSSYDYQQRLQEIQSALTSSQKISGCRDGKAAEEEAENAKKASANSMLSFVKTKDNSPRVQVSDTVRYNPKMELSSLENDEHDGFSFLSASLATESEKYKSNKQSSGPHIELRKYN